MNLFTIENVQVEPESNGGYMRCKAEVNASIEMSCNEHGNLIQRIRLRAQGSSPIEEEAMRRAIEGLLNHQYEPHIDFYKSACSCSPEPYGMAYDFQKMPQPWRSMFDNLFKNANWSLQKLLKR